MRATTQAIILSPEIPVCPQHSRVSSLSVPFPLAPPLLSAVFSRALLWGHCGCAYSSSTFCPAFGTCSLDPGLSPASLPRLKQSHGEIKGGHPVSFSDRSPARSFETGPLPDTGACLCANKHKQVFQLSWWPTSPRDLPLLCGVTGPHSNHTQLM